MIDVGNLVEVKMYSTKGPLPHEPGFDPDGPAPELRWLRATVTRVIEEPLVAVRLGESAGSFAGIEFAVTPENYRRVAS